MSRYDAIVVGAGHNGLTCACYLARAGKKVKVLERRARVGGAAATEEFHPGFRNSVAAYTVSLLQAKVIRELRLAEHGLRIVERPISNFLPLEGRYLKVGGGLDATRREFSKFSARDALRITAYWERLNRVADVLRAMALETPPNAGGGWRDVLAALREVRRLKALDMTARRDLLGLFARSAADWLDDWFESEPVKAAFGFDAVVGTYASPYQPGTAYVLLHHCFGEVNGRRGLWGHAIGGMGAISESLAAEARRLGVEIECEAPVARVRPGAVALHDGRELAARAVVANVNPKLLYLRLMEPSLLDEEFRERMARYKCGSASFRMNVALSALPRFSCLPEPGPHHGAGILMAPSLGYMDRAYVDARAEGMARAPIVEMVIPSTLDDSLAPKGAHVASLFCQHFAPEAKWGERKQEAVERIFDVVESHAPGFRASVIANTALSPADL
ncbi:MAG TPA: NAD(P)/FAD-dependent oxidoreductase, partial [Burkholderiales bacterium]|nr:NAD(P)/FAD-dependent oxidoreductase [Burkholderiales bacterium]